MSLGILQEALKTRFFIQLLQFRVQEECLGENPQIVTERLGTKDEIILYTSLEVHRRILLHTHTHPPPAPPCAEPTYHIAQAELVTVLLVTLIADISRIRVGALLPKETHCEIK